MEETKNKKIIIRIIRNYFIVSMVISILSLILFKNILYTGFVLLSSIISGLSFHFIIIMVDKLIVNKISKVKYFAFTILKTAFIGVFFVFFSKISEKFSILFILGFSSVIISIMIEGFYSFVRSLFNGRA